MGSLRPTRASLQHPPRKYLQLFPYIALYNLSERYHTIPPLKHLSNRAGFYNRLAYMSVKQDRKAAVEAIRSAVEASRGSRIWTDYVNALRLVSQVVFTRSSGFVLELIQNAEDAGQGLSGKGHVSISIDRKRLK